MAKTSGPLCVHFLAENLWRSEFRRTQFRTRHLKPSLQRRSRTALGHPLRPVDRFAHRNRRCAVAAFGRLLASDGAETGAVAAVEIECAGIEISQHHTVEHERQI